MGADVQPYAGANTARPFGAVCTRRTDTMELEPTNTACDQKRPWMLTLMAAPFANTTSNEPARAGTTTLFQHQDFRRRRMRTRRRLDWSSYRSTRRCHTCIDKH